MNESLIFIILGVLLVLLAVAGKMAGEKISVRLDKLSSRVIIGALGVGILGLGLWERYSSHEAPYPSVSISSPINNTSVSRQLAVKGTASGLLDDKYLWLFVHPVNEVGWWPQGSSVAPILPGGKWERQVYLGGMSGQRFQIAAVCASPEANWELIKYQENGEKNKEFPGRPLPVGSRVVAIVEVVLKE